MINIKLNLKELIEFDCTKKEKIQLAKYILSELLTTKEHDKFLKQLLEEELEYRMEFKQNTDIINAHNILIKNLCV